jgi:hypothetical protein
MFTEVRYAYGDKSLPILPIQWKAIRCTFGGNVLHVQIAGHAGNRRYGYSFTAFIFNSDKSDQKDYLSDAFIERLKDAVTAPVNSLACSTMTYYPAWLRFDSDLLPGIGVGTKDHPEFYTVADEALRDWFRAEVKICEENKAKEAAEKELAAKAAEAAKKAAESMSSCQQTTKEQPKMSCKKFSVFHNSETFIKCRWVINGDRVHIQVKGPKYNRSYGLAFDVPFLFFESFPGQDTTNQSRIEQSVKGNTLSLAGTSRAYTKGGVRVAQNHAGQDSVQLIVTRKAEHWYYNLRTRCTVIPQTILDYLRNN